MSPMVATEDLIDAHGVAEILGLNLRSTMSVYQQRYPDMPRPVSDLGRSRPKLWLRSGVQEWADKLRERGRTRPARHVSQ